MNKYSLEILQRDALVLSKKREKRHDEFHKIVARGLNWRSSTDCDFFMIRNEFSLLGIDLPSDVFINLTPDHFNLVPETKTLQIFDVKVVNNPKATINKTTKKYEAFRAVTEPIGWNLLIKIICYDPIKHICQNFRRLNATERQCIQHYQSDILQLESIYKDNDLFHRISSSNGDIQMTNQWDVSKVPAEDSPVWIDFQKHMEDIQPGFLDLALSSNLLDSDGKSNWRKLKGVLATRAELAMINDEENVDVNVFTRSTTEKLKTAFEDLEEKIRHSYENRPIGKAKPSIHIIYSNKNQIDLDRTKTPNEAKALMMHRLMKDVDFETAEGRHVKATFAGTQGQVGDTSAPDSTATMTKEGDIKTSRVDQDAYRMFKSRTKQGTGYKKRKNRVDMSQGDNKLIFDTTFDLEQKKKSMIHPTDEDNADEAQKSMEELGLALVQETTDRGPILKEFLMEDEYNDACSDGGEISEEILRAVATRAAYDIQQMFTNAVATCGMIKKKHVRIFYGRSDSTFLVAQNVRQSSKHGDLVYTMVVFAEKTSDIIHLDNIAEMVSVDGGYIAVMKAMRVDMQRVRLIISGLTKWIIATEVIRTQRKINVVKFPRMAAMLFCMAFSITKNMIFISDSMRYIMSNIAADVSDACGYIAEKFDPVTKDKFTVALYNNTKTTALSLNNAMASAKVNDIVIEDESIVEAGLKSISITSVLGGPPLTSYEAFENEIKMLYYMCNKGLHGDIHNKMTLAKTPFVFEFEAREKYKNAEFINDKTPFSIDPVCIMNEYMRWIDDNKGPISLMRVKLDNNGQLQSKPFNIPTMVSTKTCIKRTYPEDKGSIEDVKKEFVERMKTEAEKKKKLIAAAKARLNKRKNHLSETNFELRRAEIERAERRQRTTKEVIINNGIVRYRKDYAPVRECLYASMTDYIHTQNCKVFDRLYEMYKDGEILENDNILQAVDRVSDHENFVVGMFCKNQRSAHDREIYKSTMELKMALFVMESTYKSLCTIAKEEKITLGGDRKNMDFERVQREHFQAEKVYRRKGLHPQTVKLSADATKWSAKDNTEKFLYLEAICPFLTVKEKLFRMALYVEYMEKRFVIPDEVLEELAWGVKDVYKEGTKDFTTNNINVRWNWLQGNMNYASSFCHVLSYKYSMRMLERRAKKIYGCDEITTTFGVHSDDSFAIATYGMKQGISIADLCNELVGCVISGYARYAIELSIKKSYVSSVRVEFVSNVVVHGKTVQNWLRAIIPIHSDLPYQSFQGDVSAGIGHIQSAIRYGVPPSIAYRALSLVQHSVYSMYSMCTGQVNDPCQVLDVDRQNMPLAVGGKITADLRLLAIMGPKAHDILLSVRLFKTAGFASMNEVIEAGLPNTGIRNWNETVALMALCHPIAVLVGNGDQELPESVMQYTLIKPKVHTKMHLLKRMKTAMDFLEVIGKGPKDTIRKEDLLPIYRRIACQLPMLITSPTSAREYIDQTLFNFCNRRFREAMSADTNTSGFVRQVINCRGPVVYPGFLEDFRDSSDFDRIDDMNEFSVEKKIDYLTYKEAWESIQGAMLKEMHNMENCCSAVKNVLGSSNMIMFILNTQMQEIRTHSTDSPSQMMATMVIENNTRLTVNPEKTIIARYFFPDSKAGQVMSPIDLETDVSKTRVFLRANSRIDEILWNIIANYSDTKDEPGEWRPMITYVSSVIKLAECAYTMMTFYLAKRTAYAVQRRPRNTQHFLSMLRGRLIKDEVAINFCVKREVNYSPTFSKAPAFKDETTRISERLVINLGHNIRKIFPGMPLINIRMLIDKVMVMYEQKDLKAYVDAGLTSERNLAFRAMCIIAYNLEVIDRNHEATEWLKAGFQGHTRPYWIKKHANVTQSIGEFSVVYSNEYGQIKLSGVDQVVRVCSVDIAKNQEVHVINKQMSFELASINRNFPRLVSKRKAVKRNQVYLVLRKVNMFRYSVSFSQPTRDGVEWVICEATINTRGIFATLGSLAPPGGRLVQIDYMQNDTVVKSEDVKYQFINKAEVPDLSLVYDGFNVTSSVQLLANWHERPTVRSSISWDLVVSAISDEWIENMVSSQFTYYLNEGMDFSLDVMGDLELEDFESAVDEIFAKSSEGMSPDYEIDIIDTRNDTRTIKSIREMAVLASYRVLLGKVVSVMPDMRSPKAEKKYWVLCRLLFYAARIKMLMEQKGVQHSLRAIYDKLKNLIRLCTVTIGSFSEVIQVIVEKDIAATINKEITNSITTGKFAHFTQKVFAFGEELLDCLHERRFLDDACIYVNGLKDIVPHLDELIDRAPPDPEVEGMWS